LKNKTRSIDLDLKNYFDNNRHDILLKEVAERVNDDKMMAIGTPVTRPPPTRCCFGEKGVF
jgi:hypothetical protein